MGGHKSQRFHRRLGFAWKGLGAAIRRERSFRIQVACAALVGLACLVLRPSSEWIAIFVFCCVLVLSLELVNTAVEAALDKLHPEHSPEIGFAKDCLAGAVLVASVGSAIVFIVFLVSR